MPKRGYRLSSTLASVPVHLTAAEVCLLLLVSRSAEAGLDQATQKLWSGLITKISNRLAEPSNSKMQRLAEQTSVQEDAPRRSGGPAVLECIEEAIARRLQLRIGYQSLSSATAESRQVHPIGLYLTAGAWYLQAFDDRKQQQRTFRISRIQTADVLALPISDELLVQKVNGFHRWSLVAGPEYLVHLIVSPELARWLAENPVHPLQRIEGQELYFAARDLDRVVDWLLGLRGVSVQGPPELGDKLKSRVQEISSGLRDASCLARL